MLACAKIQRGGRIIAIAMRPFSIVLMCATTLRYNEVHFDSQPQLNGNGPGIADLVEHVFKRLLPLLQTVRTNAARSLGSMI